VSDMCPIQIGHRSGWTIADLYSAWKVRKEDRLPFNGFAASQYLGVPRPHR